MDERKQAKIQWIQDPSQSNVDNLNKVRREVSRHFRNKKKAYLRAKIEERETIRNIQNIRDLLTTSAIMLSEKKKRKRKMWSKKWYLKRNISCDAHLLNEFLETDVP